MSDPDPIENSKTVLVLFNPSDSVATIVLTQNGESTTTTVDAVEGDFKQTMANINAATEDLA